MSMDMHALAGGYAVGALSADERARFEEHLAGCEPCSREVAELREAAAQLGDAVDEPPPASLRDAVLGEIDRTPQVPPPAPDPPRGPVRR